MLFWTLLARETRPLVKWLYIHAAGYDARRGREANGNKFKLNCYIYTRIINNWSRCGRIRARCARAENACGKYTGWGKLQFAFSIGWLDLTILSPTNEHYVYIIRLNDFCVDWREYWHCPIWFSCNENHFHISATFSSSLGNLQFCAERIIFIWSI